jgi:flagellar biosynthetic protein FlhB
MADKGQKTEQPTPRRIEKARHEGQFPASREFVAAVQFMVFVAILAAWGSRWLADVVQATGLIFRLAFSSGAVEVMELVQQMAWRCFAPLMVAGGALVLISIVAQLAATRMGLSLKKLAPDVRRLNPVSRLRELLRQNLWGFAKAVVMLPLFVTAVYIIARNNLLTYLTLPLMGVQSGMRHVTGSIVELLWKAAGAFLVLGSIDLCRQHRQYRKDLRMTKWEVREEVKELEGNPQVRARVRRLQRELLRRQMMKEVKTATAVVVNPTHYAVAIRYRVEALSAPRVIAKGKNYLAQRIRALALEHQVPIVENAPLAQALYKGVDVGQEIPVHLYRAVAEILAYIYRLMDGRLPG